MLKIAICDDDITMCTQIEEIILDYAKNNSVEIEVDGFSTGIDLIKSINEGKTFDLIFLDIELGSTTGVVISNKIRNEFDDHISKIVFISSKTGYEHELFSVQPLNFLRKPITSEAIIACIELAMKLLNITAMIFDYQIGYETKRINIKDIFYFEIVDRKIKIAKKDGVDYFYGNFENIKKKLPKTFVSPHCSFLLNYNYIDTFTKKEAFMTNGIVVPISRNGLKHLQRIHIEMMKEIIDANL